jgi:hypothetical protein
MQKTSSKENERRRRRQPTTPLFYFAWLLLFGLSPPSNTNMKPSCRYAESSVSTTNCYPEIPHSCAGMNAASYRFTNQPLLAKVYPTARTMAYPSKCKPIPLVAKKQSDKVFDEEPPSVPKSWSLRHTFEDLKSGSMVYSSNYKPVSLEKITPIKKVYYDDFPAPKALSLRDTFEDEKSVSTRMTCTVSHESIYKTEARLLPINTTEARLLPIYFSPHSYSVICGRGKVRSSTMGNRFLLSVAGRYMLKYSRALHSKKEKSSIVSDILEIVRDGCPGGRGAFIRTEKNRWIELSELDARDKISSVMRNVLHNEYRSSTKSKMAKRKYEHDKALKVGIQIEAGRPLSLENMASSVDLCSKPESADATSKHEDEVVDPLDGEDLSMERFFE